MHLLVNKLLLGGILLLWAGIAYAQWNGCPPGFCNLSVGSAPVGGNNLLLEDGSSELLLEDGVSTLCLESGC